MNGAVYNIKGMQFLSIIGRLLKSLQKDFQDKLANASSTAEESISNVRTVRFFSNENKMVSSYSVDIDESYKLGRKLSGVTGMLSTSNHENIYHNHTNV